MGTSAVSLRFNRVPNPAIIGLWNSQIRQSVVENNSHEALILFQKMKQNGVEPNNLTFPFVAKACAMLSNVVYSQIIHAHIIKSPYYPNVFVQTAMLDMYIKCGQLGVAYNIFLKMPERDIASWNVMLIGFAQSGLFDEVAVTFQEMRLAGVFPDSLTVLGVSQAISYVKNPGLAKGIHSFGIQIGVDADVSVANTWISVYAKCGELGLAESVFKIIPTGLRSVVSWNSMIAGYAKLEKSSNALTSYRLMLQDGFQPDLSTIVSLLSSCVHSDSLLHGLLIHGHGMKLGFDSSISVANTLIAMYSKCGEVDSARHIFDRILERSCVSWTVIISGYAEKGDIGEALSLFNAMEAAGEKPDLVTMLSMILGCGQTGSLEVGKWIDAYAEAEGFKSDLRIRNALIDMYTKCGSTKDAWELFYAMPDKNVVSWTTMIAGCALNGLFNEALTLFYQMIELGLKPNSITFLAVLQACTHAGFLEKGWECFNMMKVVYRINPGLDHYSCLVDLLGRKGKLKEALRFIKDMPTKPDAAIWGSLLRACKMCRNIEIGEYAALHLFKLEPHMAAPYVEMANLYASAGQWNGVARIRIMMKHKQVRKSPGQSVIEVHGRTNVFSAGDRGHSTSNLIYEVLDCIILHARPTCQLK